MKNPGDCPEFFFHFYEKLFHIRNCLKSLLQFLLFNEKNISRLAYLFNQAVWKEVMK